MFKSLFLAIYLALSLCGHQVAKDSAIATYQRIGHTICNTIAHITSKIAGLPDLQPEKQDE
jgi:hypothetical protein